MAKSIKALYEDGVFKPLSKVRLKNRQTVKLTVVESQKLSKRITKTERNRPRATKQEEGTFHPAYRIVGCLRADSTISLKIMTDIFINSLESIFGHGCVPRVG